MITIKYYERDFKYSGGLNMEIVNMVFSGSVKGNELDFDDIGEKLKGLDINYNPMKFPGFIVRFKDPKITISMFRSGKMVFTGLKDEEGMAVGMKKLQDVAMLRGLDVFNGATSKLQNIVCTVDLNRELFLARLSVTLGFERVEFEPEQFPGLILRYDDPKVVFLMFGSGKIVCTGAKSRSEAERAIESLKELLDDIEGM